MDCDTILGIVDSVASRVFFEDFESGKHDSTRQRSNGGENAISAGGDVHRRSGNRTVISEV